MPRRAALSRAALRSSSVIVYVGLYSCTRLRFGSFGLGLLAASPGCSRSNSSASSRSRMAILLDTELLLVSPPLQRHAHAGCAHGRCSRRQPSLVARATHHFERGFVDRSPALATLDRSWHGSSFVTHHRYLVRVSTLRFVFLPHRFRIQQDKSESPSSRLHPP